MRVFTSIANTLLVLCLGLPTAASSRGLAPREGAPETTEVAKPGTSWFGEASAIDPGFWGVCDADDATLVTLAEEADVLDHGLGPEDGDTEQLMFPILVPDAVWWIDFAFGLRDPYVTMRFWDDDEEADRCFVDVRYYGTSGRTQVVGGGRGLCDWDLYLERHTDWVTMETPVLPVWEYPDFLAGLESGVAWAENNGGMPNPWGGDPGGYPPIPSPREFLEVHGDDGGIPWIPDDPGFLDCVGFGLGATVGGLGCAGSIVMLFVPDISDIATMGGILLAVPACGGAAAGYGLYFACFTKFFHNMFRGLPVDDHELWFGVGVEVDELGWDDYLPLMDPADGAALPLLCPEGDLP